MSIVADNQDLRPDVQARIRQKVEKSLPDQASRLGALQFLAYAIENADEQRSDAWYLQETRRGLTLMAGRLMVCKLTRGALQVSVLGPIPEQVGTALGIREDENEEWRFVPGGVSVWLPPERAVHALELLKDAYDKFVDQARAPPLRLGSAHRE